VRDEVELYGIARAADGDTDRLRAAAGRNFGRGLRAWRGSRVIKFPFGFCPRRMAPREGRLTVRSSAARFLLEPMRKTISALT
jgi:hypothetical protein